jgi:chromosome partitioning protein
LTPVIIVVAGLKGGVGKTTTAVYLAAVAAGSKRDTTLVDADPQASAADWLELGDDEVFEQITLVEAPTDRLLLKTIDRVDADEVAIVDTPPGQERLLAKAIEHASVVVIPTRVGGVETPRVEAVLDLVPTRTPVGLVICSARTYTRDYQDMVAAWEEANVPVWGTVSERVAIASGPQTLLALDGLDSYRAVWRRVLREARG